MELSEVTLEIDLDSLLARDVKLYPSSLPKTAVLVGFIAAIAFSVVGSVLNLVTLYTFCSCKKLRQHSTTSFVISLTVSDLLYCAFCLPVTADTFAHCQICHVEWLCRLYAFAFYWNITAMMLNQCAVAFNRYITVCFPVKAPIKFTLRNNLILIFVTWLIPFVCLLMPLTNTWGSLGFDEGTGTCTFAVEPGHGTIPRRVYFAIGLGIPTLIILFCYVNIYLTFKQSSQRIREQESGNLNSSHVESSAHSPSSPPSEKEDYEMLEVANATLSGTNQEETNRLERLFQRENRRANSLKGPVKKTILKRSLTESRIPVQGRENKYMSFTGSTLSIESPLKNSMPNQRRYSEAVTVRAKERELRREKNEQRITTTLFAIFVAFITCTVPPAFVLSIDPEAKKFPNWHIPSYIFGWMFGVVNPIIYVAFNQTYREAFRVTLSALIEKISKPSPANQV
ncbi:hypothetical protein TCAL_02749 [Tigriopus californicus]|uniref:G-protein coupled receptors family 1 profile domain-containing protein n=1 Tax=Tigriopus californicus TaxID=6832 RepID=A0A553NQL6_TIGCA|nr:protein trapped in endoderm-1-like [Tigriopus californicus]TRY67714.1 hypothetical protein TCAL_02749 [Tigriopus californicus]|eukprot:TCALIF_02749-PA protein Name:"Similar to Tre1 Protein trapped in endoderm-1 (Drosophila melanogaster)" AED:0.15 eAED:0.15 QI:0/0.85/0.75/1/1/1/8/19/453